MLAADWLEAAWFDPKLLDELAVDPRAYDFNHPVNKRPNYHFGQWDPHHLDAQGRYRRFVMQQVTLDALLERLETRPDLPREELLFEVADLPAQGRLGGVQGFGGAAEIPVLGDDDETPHQPQVEVRLRRRQVEHNPSLALAPLWPTPQYSL